MGHVRLPRHHTGTIDHPLAYEVSAAVWFLGARRAVFTRLAAMVRPRAGDRILDVGCGTGYLTRILSPVAGPAGEVTGLDPSPAMIQYAAARARGNCRYVLGGAQTLPFPDGSFDAVTATLVVHHIPADDRPEALGEMYRVLRPGGRLLVVESRPLAGRLGPTECDLRDVLGSLIVDAGFQVESEGELPYLLYYVRAARP
ncbi:class I SAM-dependent methyltransferase [Nonomuraea aridisoli]|uniref:Methyltransferase n=1 Tax=Nonomuraea aridisoli TaxID=2070368 RepID=A0A2W2EFD6_9ACTN|nr:class I SAM-dependent methyltransferase [Nonomuraea aridisoli]PZG21123.1 methyltransferase [Nonomuraea aridisoli]